MYGCLLLSYFSKFGDNRCMRNAQNCPKMPYVIRKVESDHESRARIKSTPKFNHFQRVTSCPSLPSLVDFVNMR